MTRAQILAQLAVRDALDESAGAAEGAVHKWTLLRTLGEIREGIGVSDRALGVLSALLSFHPETALTLAPERGEPRLEDGAPPGEATSPRPISSGLIVFPSNRALSSRCNGMSEATLRRHLAALVEAGLIIRRDSPNGKRFARRAPSHADGVVALRGEGRGQGGASAESGPTQAFGFDLAPLAARAGEFEARLEALRADQLRLRLLKERVTLLRRDLSKRLAFALDEGLAGPWEGLRARFVQLCAPLRKLREGSELTALAGALERLLDEVGAGLEAAMRRQAQDRASHTATDKTLNVQNQHGYGAHFGRRHTESNPDQFQDLEPASKKAGTKIEPESLSRPSASERPHEDRSPESNRDLPLAIILDACPDIRDYDFSGRSDMGRSEALTWPAFRKLAGEVRPMLGVSPDAWREAREVLGENAAATAIAFILQRCEHSSEARRHIGPDGKTSVSVNGAPAIRSPGGYLRALTQKGAQRGERERFSLWGAILGHLAQRSKTAARGQEAGAGRDGTA